MIYGLYSVKDECVGYDRPIMFDNDYVAIRNFGLALEDENSYIYKFPLDYSIWHIANFDSDTGILTPVEHKKIADAMQFKRRKESKDVSE